MKLVPVDYTSIENKPKPFRLVPLNQETNPMAGLSTKGGSSSPANIQAQKNLDIAKENTNPLAVMAKAGEESTKDLPFGNAKMPFTPRNMIGETGKAASLLLGPVEGGAALMGGQAIEDKKSPIGVALATGEGALAGKLLKTGGELAEKAIKMIPKPVEDRIYSLYNSTIGGAKAKNVGDLGKIKSDRVSAMKAIHDNISDIKLENPETGEMESRAPKNRLELAHAFQQTKQNIWKEVSALSQGATDHGAIINLSDLAEKAGNDAKKSIGEVALKTNPMLAQNIDNAVQNIKQAGKVSPTDAQEYMKYLNSEIQRLRNSGQAVDYSVKDLYSNLLGHLNEQIDKTIEESLDRRGYRDLRRQYGSLKSAEKEIVNSANRYARTSAPGGKVHPFVNLWSLEDAMQGVAEGVMGNPVGGAFKIARGAAIKGASKLSDHMLSPDRRISQMFDLMAKHAPGESNIANLEGTNLSKVGELSRESSIVRQPTTEKPLLRLPKPEPQYLRERQSESIKPLGVNKENLYMKGVVQGENPIKKLPSPEPSQPEYIKNRQEAEEPKLGAPGKPLDIEFIKGGSKETIPMRGASQRATYNPKGETGSASTKALATTATVGTGAIVAKNAQASTLGERNNNPGNLKSTQKWEGMTGKDKFGHAIFKDKDHGIRALIKDLRTHAKKHPNETLSHFLSTSYAQKNGDKEASFVASKLGISPNQRMSKLDVYKVAKYLSKIESKTNVSDEDISRVRKEFKI